MKPKKWSLQIGGRPLEIETGVLAGQANGSVRVEYGDTVVLATAVMSKSAAESRGYFPLMVDYEERFYAAGKIKGSRFIKREGKPTDEAILTARLIDRTLRPLFDEQMRNEVQIVVTVLSIDQENDPDVVSMIAASTALHISDIPWNGPIGAVRVGKVNKEFILNPVNGDLEQSELDLVISGTKDKINMVEAGAQEIPENEIIKSFEFGQEAIKKITDFQEEIRKDVGTEKAKPALIEPDEKFVQEIKNILQKESYEEAIYSKAEKEEKYEKLDSIREKIGVFIKENHPLEERSEKNEEAEFIMDEVANDLVHKNILEKDSRPDGRKLDEIRDISTQTCVLPRTHGSGLFTRGETQVLSVATLAAPGQEQLIDSMEETDVKKRYMHHYNFPPYSVGETKPMRGPGRREIGHGALAERALEPVIPSKEDFPYTIRVVSEVLSSNGSSSMASTCGSTLALMDAGVPIKSPVSGIAMGIIISGDKFKVLTDIQGLEDHFGDMDFKVAGTVDGITALQMDVKVDGINTKMLTSVLEQSHKNRMEILDKMKAAISEPKKELSPYAPRVINIQINPEKIRDVIGPGGKVINEIIDETGVQIDIEDDGSVFITSTDEVSAQKALEWIENLTHEVKPGEVFNGKVTRLMNFGAFAEILPGQEGLIHISELADHRVEKVEDVVKVGDVVPVKVIEIDAQGRINLSLKAAAKIMK